MSQKRLQRFKEKMFQKTINLEAETSAKEAAIHKYKRRIQKLEAELVKFKGTARL